MEVNHLVNLLSELAPDLVCKYVRSDEQCVFVKIDTVNVRLYTKTPDGKDFEFASTFIQALAENIEENIPFNTSQLLNNKGSNRAVIDSIIAHTSEFYWLQDGRSKFLVWIPSKPHNAGELVEWTDIDLLKKLPKVSLANNQAAMLNRTFQKIFFGAPGTGKSHEVKRLTGELLNNDEKVDLPNVFRTTFHPDTDYASFVGCYKPTMKPTSKEEKTLTGKDEEIVYEYVPQVFTDAYVYAYSNPTEQTYLVIEEINRGNCAQIFGDLFQLLDRKNGVSEYTIKADKDLAKHLVDVLGADSAGIKDGKLCLPDNLHILATMNTSDQSLFPMDSAFKRRWEWEYVPINYGDDVPSGSFEITIDDKTYPWVGFIQKVNEKIFDLTQSEDKQMGNFFIKNSIGEDEFKSKVMFYLWYEVLRDETGNNKYFFNSVEGKPFTFKDLYDSNAKETIKQFMEYLGVPAK